MTDQLAINPWDYCIKNQLGWGEGEIVRYVTHWKEKNSVEDLRKAKRIIEFLINSEVQVEDKQLPLLPANPPIVEYTLTEHDVMGLV
jgi:hypothetical protein